MKTQEQINEIKSMQKLQKIEQIIKDRDNDNMPEGYFYEDYFYINKIKEVLNGNDIVLDSNQKESIVSPSTFKDFGLNIKDILKEEYNNKHVATHITFSFISFMGNTRFLRIKDEKNDVGKDYNLHDMYVEYMDGNVSYEPVRCAKAIKEDFDSFVNMVKLDKTTDSEENI